MTAFRRVDGTLILGIVIGAGSICSCDEKVADTMTVWVLRRSIEFPPGLGTYPAISTVLAVNAPVAITDCVLDTRFISVDS